MNVVQKTLSELSVGPGVAHNNLTMVPLMNGGGREADYITLEEALRSGAARVTEVSAGGYVPELRFVNEGDRAVLLLDGEVLVGAKQNRTLNLTILAPAGKTITIPVSCVEQGRWTYDRPDFAPSAHMQFSEGRGRKAASVNRSMFLSGRKASDQGDVWHAIHEKMDRMGVSSSTSAMNDIFDQYHGSVEEYTRAITSREGQVGAAFTINGRVVGLDLFDCPETLGKVFPKLVRSCALDAVERTEPSEAPPKEDGGALEKFVKAIASARFQGFPAVGEGEDVRFEGQSLAGGALVARDRVVHLCAFNLSQVFSAGGNGFARASARRRHYA